MYELQTGTHGYLSFGGGSLVAETNDRSQGHSGRLYRLARIALYPAADHEGPAGIMDRELLQAVEIVNPVLFLDRFSGLILDTSTGPFFSPMV